MAGDTPATRRRGAELEDAILGAVWAELAEVGYAKLTLEGVAARAHTSRPVLSRRWSSRTELIAAALNRGAPTEDDLPDTGDVRTDLIEVLSRLAHRFDELPGNACVPLMIELLSNPDLAPDSRALLQQRTETILAVLRRAVARGDIDPNRLTARVVRVPFALLREEYFASGGKAPDDASLAEIVDEIILPLLHYRAPENRLAGPERGA